MKLRELITERLEDVSKDADNVYRKYFSEIKSVFTSSDKVRIIEFARGIRHRTTSGRLISLRVFVSDRVIRAHKEKPVDVLINIERESFYDPMSGELSFGIITDGVVSVLNDYDFKYKKMPIEVQRWLTSQLSEHHIKSLINHELAHWIDDALHGHHMGRRFKKALDKHGSDDTEALIKTRDHGYSNPYLTKEEIHALVHEIKVYRDKYIDRWDTMTFNDLIYLMSSLFTIYNDIRRDNPKELELWKKRLKKRMAREGLLGKRMR